MALKIALVSLVLFAMVLVFTDDRWDAIIDGTGSTPMLVLVIAWIALTHVLERVIGRVERISLLD